MARGLAGPRASEDQDRRGRHGRGKCGDHCCNYSDPGDTKVILVSTSKAGPKVALAIGKILAPDETDQVKAWISIGGLIRGTPISGLRDNPAAIRYARLREGGPNDGLTLLADELLPDGIAIVEPGIDHFYAAPDIEVKSVALANVVAEMVQGQCR